MGLLKKTKDTATDIKEAKKFKSTPQWRDADPTPPKPTKRQLAIQRVQEAITLPPGPKQKAKLQPKRVKPAKKGKK